MAFLFKSSKKHQNSAIQPGQPPGLSGSNSSIPGANGASVGVLQKERDRGGANQTPTPSSSVNNSSKSLGGADTPSPEQKVMIERVNREHQVSCPYLYSLAIWIYMGAIADIPPPKLILVTYIYVLGTYYKRPTTRTPVDNKSKCIFISMVSTSPSDQPRTPFSVSPLWACCQFPIFQRG
jgi:hypothetical protein